MLTRIFGRAAALLLAACLLICPFASCAEPENDLQGEQQEQPSGATAKKRIAFTFDDGPTPTVTAKILGKLESIGGKATFFQVGNRHNYIDSEVYSKAISLGCEIGTHSWSHPNGFSGLSSTDTSEQLEKSVSAIEQESGKKVTLFRPVGGSVSSSQLELAASMGLHTVNWSLDTEDWKEQTNDTEAASAFIDEKVNYIVNNAKDGDIILMHELYLSSYEIFSRAADKLIEKGFALVTVSEILELEAGKKPNAVIYTKGKQTFYPDAVG